MKSVEKELQRMKVAYEALELIQDKDGVMVVRVMDGKQSYIVKYFACETFRREIAYYQMLQELHIPTIQILDASDCALLMEDINASSVYRLGCEEDLHHPAIASLVAKWYRELHTKGYEYVKTNGVDLYDENDLITLDVIKEIKHQTKTEDLPVWDLLESKFSILQKKLSQAHKTITYNDFYYTNLIVSKDETSAMMYDYNLLGKGYAYADLRNVCSALSPEASKCFMESYGCFDQMEMLIDDVVNPIISLHMACKKEQFPHWAKSMVSELSTIYSDKVKRLLSDKIQ